MFKLSKIDRVKSLSERNACHCAHEPDYSWRNEKSVPNILGCSDTLDWVPALCYCWLQHNDWNYRYHGKIYNCTQESYWTRTTVYKSLWKSNREDCITLLEKKRNIFSSDSRLVVAWVKIHLLASLIMMLELNKFLYALWLLFVSSSRQCFHRIFTRFLCASCFLWVCVCVCVLSIS